MYTKEQIREAISTILLDHSDLTCTECLRIEIEILKELESSKV
jgi:hypothetical protein